MILGFEINHKALENFKILLLEFNLRILEIQIKEICF